MRRAQNLRLEALCSVFLTTSQNMTYRIIVIIKYQYILTGYSVRHLIALCVYYLIKKS